MDTLYIDCRMGVNGVKLLGAIIDTMDNPDSFVYNFNKLDVTSIAMQRTTDAQNGITGSYIEFIRRAATEFDPYADEVDDDDSVKIEMPSRQVRTLKDIIAVIDDMPVSQAIKDRAIKVYENIAKADAKANGISVNKLRMYRTGSRDVIAAVVGVFMALEELKPERIIVSTVAVGDGYSYTPRGRLPIPVPEMQILLNGVPYTAGVEPEELCTLDGAALIAEIADEFANMPEMTVQSSGAGFGRRTFKNGINCVRAYLGKSLSTAANESYIELRTEIYGIDKSQIYAISSELEGLGIVSAHITDIFDINGNPGITLDVITYTATADTIATYIMEKIGAKRVMRSIVKSYTA